MKQAWFSNHRMVYMAPEVNHEHGGAKPIGKPEMEEINRAAVGRNESIDLANAQNNKAINKGYESTNLAEENLFDLAPNAEISPLSPDNPKHEIILMMRGSGNPEAFKNAISAAAKTDPKMSEWNKVLA